MRQDHVSHLRHQLCNLGRPFPFWAGSASLMSEAQLLRTLKPYILLCLAHKV